MKRNSMIDFGILGASIRARREDLNITQENMAILCKCTATHICRIEHGTPVGLETLVRVCSYLQISLDDALGMTFYDRPLLRNVLDLFMTHSKEEQELALYELKTIFNVIDLTKDLGKGASLEALLNRKGLDLEKVPPVELFDEEEKELINLMAAEDPNPYGKESLLAKSNL